MDGSPERFCGPERNRASSTGMPRVPFRGLAAPILYLLKNKHAYQTAYASFLFDLFLILFGAIFKNRFQVFEAPIICFDIFILIITFLFGLFLHLQAKKLRGNEEA